MNRNAGYENRSSAQLAVGLGWFSVALGVAELAAPRSVARFIGVAPDATTVSVLRSYGARKLSNGVAILAQPDRAAWLWSRAAGNALDLATLASAMRSPNTNQGRAMFAAAALTGVTALDVWCAQQLSAQENGRYSDIGYMGLPSETRRPHKTVRIAEAVTINQPIERVEERWSNLEVLPRSLQNLGATDKMQSMRALVQFRQAPGARGTEVHVEIEYEPATGAIRNTIAKLFGQDPAAQIRDDLRRFKQLMETGEMTVSDRLSLWRPAQPAANPQQVPNAPEVGVSR